jgi:pyruvate dehydrogenase E2 component (dihydrolipoyllysine-residue acetyltransferase)
MSTTEVIAPALPLGASGGRVRWRRSRGGAVVAGEPLAEIETDAAILEIAAPATGLLDRVAPDGAAVVTGDRLAIIAAPRVGPEAAAARLALLAVAVSPDLAARGAKDLRAAADLLDQLRGDQTERKFSAGA